MAARPFFYEKSPARPWSASYSAPNKDHCVARSKIRSRSMAARPFFYEEIARAAQERILFRGAYSEDFDRFGIAAYAQLDLVHQLGMVF